MKKHLSLFLAVCCISINALLANTLYVKNANELANADKKALPGDIIILKNGDWQNVHLQLNAIGTENQPIFYKAETAGKVRITGLSTLTIGGAYLTVDGFLFQDGQAGENAIICFRSSKDKVSNHCRVTNTVIDGFNNTKRLDENYWVELYGKNNRVDHCEFRDKKNMGVLMAVILDDERSRENNHSIDHNHFGFRIPLASNTGEMIRVGVSQHCEFNSNTQITENYFDRCDGETEIISIKSGANLINKNFFFECQGSVVLRHGNNNTVSNNVFIGNNKIGTGGVRIINEGQWVLNNFFYQCRGEGFRAPLCIMNGVPNSPAFRYLPVANALVANNSFIDCAPMGFCEGSDTERSQVPRNVLLLNNLLVNNKDAEIYHTYDNIKGFQFSGNLISKTITQTIEPGFKKTSTQKVNADSITVAKVDYHSISFQADSIQKANPNRNLLTLYNKPGYSNQALFASVKSLSKSGTGTNWFVIKESSKKTVRIDCATADNIHAALEKNKGATLVINLTGLSYEFQKTCNIACDLTILSSQKAGIKFITKEAIAFLFQIKSGAKLALQDVNLNLDKMTAQSFIATDSSGSSDHLNFSMKHASINQSNGNFFFAARKSIADSIVVQDCLFAKGAGVLFEMNTETDKKGYYNVELMKIEHCVFIDYLGQVLSIRRTGTDESTMGPMIRINNNSFSNIGNNEKTKVLFQFEGIQYTNIQENVFNSCNSNGKLIKYTDEVKAVHYFNKNKLRSSGEILKNKFVVNGVNDIN